MRSAGECSQPASGKGSACKSHAPSQLFKYDLTLTWGEMTIAGVKRPVILTNGQYPAPLINVSVGDRVVITVHNELQVCTRGVGCQMPLAAAARCN